MYYLNWLALYGNVQSSETKITLSEKTKKKAYFKCMKTVNCNRDFTYLL